MTESSAESVKLRSSAPYRMSRAMTVAAVALFSFLARQDGHSPHADRDARCTFRRDVKVVGAVTDQERGSHRVPELIDPTALEEGLSRRLGPPWTVSVYVREEGQTPAGSGLSLGSYQIHVTDGMGVTFESAWSFLTMGLEDKPKLVDNIARRIKTVLGIPHV